MCPTKHFLNTFLENRGLPEQNGQRLHQYYCDDDEYMTLCHLLIDCNDVEHLRSPLDHFIPDPDDELDWNEVDEEDVMACFVLYASEWCRRWNEPRRRTWRRLFGHIHWEFTNYPQLYPAIEHGLRRWGRPVIRMPGSTRYFDTIAHEGGIPIEGVSVIEYELVSQGERQARYEPQYMPEGFQLGEALVPKRPGENAPSRMIALLNTGSVG